MDIYTAHYKSPIGLMHIRGSQKGIMSVRYCDEKHPDSQEHDHLLQCIEQLDAYFTSSHHIFHSLPLHFAATDFQRDVWEATGSIAPGERKTYGQIAKMVGNPRASRAVGTALKTNPLLLLIPCHRVVPHAKGIGQYAGGDWRKEWLLNYEGGARSI